MSFFASLGLEPIINASGPATRLGGMPMTRTVLEAYQEAASEAVPLELLQGAASRMIGQITGAEAGIVTSGASAALTLGAAAIMTRFDACKMDLLPDVTGFPHEFIVAREQRTGYDRAVRVAGGRLVEVGMNEPAAGAGCRRTEAWEYEAAFGAQTAGILYVYTADSQPPLEEVVARAKPYKLPVLVDAAAQLPPRSNLMLPAMTGADLVVFSGGKAIGGPQGTGILCGRRDLVGAALLQMLDLDEPWELWQPPSELIPKEKLAGLPRHGVGRGLKVAKEDVAALLTALAMFSGGAAIDERERQCRMLRTIKDFLCDSPAFCDLFADDDETFPILEITVAGGGKGALDVCRRLRQGSPPIYVGTSKMHDGKLIIHPACLVGGAAQIIARRPHEELG